MISDQYRELFALVARNGAINGEKAVEVIKKEEPDNANISKTTEMVQIFRDLEDKLRNGEELNDMDYVYLYIGATVTSITLQKSINTWTAVVKEYNENLIPALYAICLENDSDKKNKLISEKFAQQNIDKTEN